MHGSTWGSLVLITAFGCRTTAPSGPTRALANEQPTSSIELGARFTDATGVRVGARVVIAGLDIGRVTRLDPADRGTLVWFALRNEPEVWSNATLTKKASRTLGEHYLELEPGTAAAGEAFRLGPGCPSYASRVREDALRCREVVTVVEALTPDGLMQRIEQTLPDAPP